MVNPDSMLQSYKIINRDPRKSAEALLSAMLQLLTIRDRYTLNHNQRVADYATRMASRLDLPPREVENIRMGGLLHDIGKIVFSQKLFDNDSETLTADMRSEIQRHPLTGMSLLKAVHVPDPVLECVYFHHERWDGTGYPCGLKSDEIPLGARIISVADCFDAITTDRPYQKRKSRWEAIGILQQLSGRNLCPELVNVFCDEIRTNTG